MNNEIRSQFPSLTREINNRQAVYLDGPAGTQVPQSVIDAMSQYYRQSNANTHGHFITSHETDTLITETRQACADFLNAESSECISFGANMTSLCFSLSRGFGRILKPGDRIVITQLDHEANRGPWLTLEERGIEVVEINLLPDGTLDYADAAQKINTKTRIVAAGFASNILGTINDLAKLRQLSRDAGAWLVVDAVHSTPHMLTDVQALGCDFLLCSAYKFYGPHVGILYSKPGLLDQIPTDRLRTQEQRAPYSIETGTLNHAALAGVKAAIEFIASFGTGGSVREQLSTAFQIIRKHEHKLGERLWQGLQNINGITCYGPNFNHINRAPTISFAHDRLPADDISTALGSSGIFTWAGHFYAIRATEVLGLAEKGGVVRMGMVVYNSEEEIDYTLESVTSIVSG